MAEPPGPLLSFRLLPSHHPPRGQGLGQGTEQLILHSFAGMTFPNSHPEQSQESLCVDFIAYLAKFRAGCVPSLSHTFRTLCSSYLVRI